jgi:hypothetical protein
VLGAHELRRVIDLYRRRQSDLRVSKRGASERQAGLRFLGGGFRGAQRREIALTRFCTSVYPTTTS